jgi:hypothetical protein
MIKAEVIGKFDLGYITRLEDGREGQLRAIEMKSDCLQPHIKGLEHELFGKIIRAYIIKEADNRVLLSQFSDEDREQREKESELKSLAVEACKIGQEFEVEIVRKLQWGFFFKQVSGYLESAIKNENLSNRASLKVGDTVIIKVAGYTENNRPIFDLKMD